MLVAPSVYCPVTTVSPSTRPLVISVEEAVAMPVSTWRKTGLPSCITRTNDVVELPDTAVVGTRSTSSRCSMTMSRVPVMPDLASSGRSSALTVMEYCVELDEPEADEDDAGSLEMKLILPVNASAS